MGVIKRQSIKQSLVNYIAVAIGAVSMIYIYPEDRTTYGLARFIIDTSMMIAPFVLMGFSGVTIRFFPQLKKADKSHPGFLFFLISVVLGGSLLFVLLSVLLKNQFYQLFADKDAIYQAYLPYLVPIGILLAFIQLFYSYSINFKRIVVPSMFQNLIKISLPVLILLFIWNYISLDAVVNGILINFVIAFIGLVIYIYWLGELKVKADFSFLTKEKTREIKSFALFGLFGSIGSVLAFRIDSFMISTFLDYENNGTFAIAAFIANVIAIPTNAVNQISAPIITESFKNNELNHIRELYKSSSINLLIIGFLLFICIAASIEDLISIMPNNDGLQDGVMIVILIGAARLIDMGTSINNQIINYSKFYRFGFYAIIMMAFFNVITNYVLIPKFQIIGVAMATLASLTLYNLVKMIFIKWRFDMQPFSSKTIVILLVAGFVYGLSQWIPEMGNAYLDIIIRSLLIAAIYTALVYYLKISKEVNETMDKLLNRFAR